MSTHFITNNKLITYGGIIFLCCLTLICYADIIQWMVNRYTSADSYYSHGFLIPLVSIFLIWQEKDRLHMLENTNSYLGLIIVLLSLLLHIVGTVIYIHSVSGFSLFFLIIGLTLFLFGFQITRIIAFPLVFLVFMFPLPMAFISTISFPLKIIAAKSGVWFVSLLGVPVLQEGFHISIPGGSLIVGNPCSGLRSLISFLALGGLYSYLTPLPLIKKWILFITSIPIALLVNMVRVSILVLISHFWGLAAAAPDTIAHTDSGIIVFVIGILFLFLNSKVLE